jgi:hypothetical protein
VVGPSPAIGDLDESRVLIFMFFHFTDPTSRRAWEPIKVWCMGANKATCLLHAHHAHVHSYSAVGPTTLAAHCELDRKLSIV